MRRTARSSAREDGALEHASHTTEPEKRLRSSAPYTSKIIKAGALIGDTKTLLSHWDVDASVDENINRVQRENVFGKASRSRIEDILAIFRQRYLSEQPVTRALVTFVQGKFPTVALERLLYFHSARADQLLYDAVTEILVPMQARGLVDINVQDFQRSLANWVEEGKTNGHWSESTITRMPQELLSALRDFGVLQGAYQADRAGLPPHRVICVCRLLSETAPTIGSEADRAVRLELVLFAEGRRGAIPV